MGKASLCARVTRSNFPFFSTKSCPADWLRLTPSLPQTTTLTPSINISSDRMADRYEHPGIRRSRAEYLERTAVAPVCQPNLHPRAHRSSPQPLHEAQDLGLSARPYPRAIHWCSRHLPSRHRGQLSRALHGPRGRHSGPRRHHPALLRPPRHLLRLHGHFYLAVPW